MTVIRHSEQATYNSTNEYLLSNVQTEFAHTIEEQAYVDNVNHGSDIASNTTMASISNLQRMTFRYCLSLTKSRTDAEDLVQDTWLKVLNRKQGHNHANPEALLLTIARNTWIDQLRRKQLGLRKTFAERSSTVVQDESSLGIESALQAIIRHLPPLQRTVFMLRDVFGYSIVETAEKLETTVGAVKAAHHRARQSLEAVKREMIGDDLLSKVSTMPDESQEEAERQVLHAFVSAYRLEDAEALVQLYQSNSEARLIQKAPTPIAKMSKNRLADNGYPHVRSCLSLAA